MPNEEILIEKQTEPESTEAKPGVEGIKDGEPGNADAIPAPVIGFDDTGEFFIVKAHVRYGQIYILGLLQKAGDWLKVYAARQAQEMEARKLIKPKVSNKLMGRFSLFKGK